MASPLRRYLTTAIASVTVAMAAAFAASWAIWWFWYDVPPPQVVVPDCGADGSDLYVQVVAFKGWSTEYHCFHLSDASDVQRQLRNQPVSPTPLPEYPPLLPDPNAGDMP